MKHVTNNWQQLAILVILLTGFSGLNGQIFSNNDLSISPLYEGTWVIETTDMTTMYLLEGKKRALLIDTGTKCDSLDNVIGHITSKPLEVVITHVHPDHAGNISYFERIYIHPADTVLLQGNYQGKVSFVKDGDQFDLGSRVIEVSHMPGHTPGSIILLDRKNKSCFTGDAFGSGQVWLQLKPFTPMAVYAQSCRKMLEIMDEGVTKIYCGHYPYVKKAFGKDYIVAMEKLADAIDDGTEPEPEPYPIKIPEIGTDNPMITTMEEASIVYDPNYIK